MTKISNRPAAGAARRGIASAGVVLAVLSFALGSIEARAQGYGEGMPIQRQDPMMPRRMHRGGGGVGVGAAIGLGLGLLGAAAASRAAAEEDAPPPRRVREPRRVRDGVRVIEVEEDAPPSRATRRVDRHRDPPRKKPPRAVERTPGPAIRLPAKGETRFLAGEVLVELKGRARIESLAERLDLEVLGSLPVVLTKSTLHRLRSRDGRSTTQILGRLRRERTVAFAQPNWVYTLQQDAATPVAPVPGAAIEAPPAPAGDPPGAQGGTIAATAASLTVAPPALAPLPGQYAAEKLHLAAAHGRVRGAGVRVAVIDTGADVEHPELVGAIEARFDALDGVDPSPGVHGTAMAGAIAARLRLSGSAPAARLLVARAFGPPAANGVAQGSTYHVVKCLDWAVSQHARIVSMSFAGPSNALLTRAIAAAHAEGVVMVAAAGNAGPQSPPLFPAANPDVIAVTASDADDRILSVANRGSHVAVTAPGVDILVAAPRGGYDLTSGTSVAAAEVSGIAALLLERRTGLTPDDVRRILTTTAIDLGPRGRDPIFGAGLVDAEAAVVAASKAR